MAYYAGTELKVKVELTCDGFDQASDNWSLMVMWGNGRKKDFSKSDMVTDTDGNYYLPLDTTGMSGKVTVVATLQVPDEDFADGYRQVVLKSTLASVESV